MIAGQNGAVVRSVRPGISRPGNRQFGVGHPRDVREKRGELRAHNVDVRCEGGPGRDGQQIRGGRAENRETRAADKRRHREDEATDL